jgi:hypothetical protein
VIDDHPLGQDYISKGALVLVVAVRLDRDVFLEDEGRGSLLRAVAEGSAFLGAVDAAEADTLRVGVVQNFDDAAGEDGDNGAGEGGSLSNGKPTEK